MQKNIPTLNIQKKNASMYPVLVKINQINTQITQIKAAVSILDIKYATYNTKISKNPDENESSCGLAMHGSKNDATEMSRWINLNDNWHD